MVESVHHERAVVGLSLLDPTVIDRYEIDLGGYTWIDEPVGQLWGLLCRMRRDGHPVGDIRLVVAEAKSQGILDALGGVSAIAHLGAVDASAPYQGGYHVTKLQEAMERLRLRRLADSMTAMIESDSSNEDIVSMVSSRLYSPISTATNARAIGELAKLAIDEATKPGAPSGVMSGLSDLDYLTGGFRPGEMIVLAARPNVGKSALAAQWGIHAAQSGHSVLFISLEMKSIDVATRALASEGSMPLDRMRHRTMSDLDTRLAYATAEKLMTLPMRISDHRSLTIDRLAGLIRSEASRKKLGLVVVDYLGLLSTSNSRKPRWEAMTEISNAIKTLALAELLPIVTLCQLNRDSEGGDPPQLSHLRDSGAIEQDADLVCLLHRPSRQAAESTLTVAKNRNGECGKMHLFFDAPRVRFEIEETPEF